MYAHKGIPRECARPKQAGEMIFGSVDL